MHRTFYFLSILLVLKVSTFGQVASGSIVVFGATGDKFFAAADSRANFGGLSPRDDYCKLHVLNDRYVFSGTGFDLNTVEQASNAIHQFGNVSLDAIAETWVKLMQREWRLLYIRDPASVQEMARRNGGLLTGGVFAAPQGGRVGFTIRSVGFDPTTFGSIRIDPPSPCTSQICAMGKTEIFREFGNRLSDRARAETWTFSPSLLKRADRLTATAIRFVELTILYGPADVGGFVDAVELWKDGTVHWVQRKENCPTTE